MNNCYHQERSRLIQKHKEEIKLMEKEIKSKKGILKERLQNKLEHILERHQKEVEEFESRHVCDSKPRKDGKLTGDDNSEINGSHNKIILFEERHWNSLSKSELESECKLRGINSKGSKEDLVTRLFVFTADQKSKLNSLSEVPKNSNVCNFSKNNESNISIKTPFVQEIKKITPPEINFSKAGGVGKKKFRNQCRKTDHRKNFQPDENSWAAFCTRNDIPRRKNNDLNVYEDSDLSNQDEEDQSDSKNEHSHSSDEEHNSENNENENIPVDEDHEKINKRRALMVKVLEKMLSKATISERKNGIKLSDIDSHLTKLNVKNFRPELLGYKSTEEWISSQSKGILTYDSKNKTVFPPGSMIFGSKESNKDDMYYIDYLSEPDSSDNFM
ncbi:hypothetical protein FG386_002623 [Cryptosporidium ryanae]|uniref:uncharacterized protein n=1 Tax=Cryptosporidium ryanae TaxID=515981 RepID=UPI00351A3C81|nr:hypothetical protein FG386_002623 [Cryptosporidium ryanae]